MDLRERLFELVENPNGHAQSSTRIKFTGDTSPFVATYDGPNIVKGQAMVTASDDCEYHMIYQALTTDRELVAGRARVLVEEGSDRNAIMILEWEWLTGDRSNGVSRWIEIVNS